MSEGPLYDDGFARRVEGDFPLDPPHWALKSTQQSSSLRSSYLKAEEVLEVKLQLLKGS